MWRSWPREGLWPKSWQVCSKVYPQGAETLPGYLPGCGLSAGLLGGGEGLFTAVVGKDQGFLLA